jgi:hypothetical protein
MRSQDLSINDFKDYKIETLFARDKNKELFVTTTPEKASIIYKVNNRLCDWGNYEGSSLEAAITAYNEM